MENLILFSHNVSLAINAGLWMVFKDYFLFAIDLAVNLGNYQLWIMPVIISKLLLTCT